MIGLMHTINATIIAKANFHFLKTTQNKRHSIFARRITGNAMPMKEKNAVRNGDIYQAGKDSRSKKMDKIVIVRTIAFVSFCIINKER